MGRLTCSSAVAIEEMGGPKIGFSYGRVDEMDPGAVTPDGRLPDADKGDGPGKKTTKGRGLHQDGLGDRELVALSGAHALGRCHADASGYEGRGAARRRSSTTRTSSCSRPEWTPDDTKAKFQYKDPSGRLMMLPSDIALIEDKKLADVLEYAKDQKKFFADFAAAFEKPRRSEPAGSPRSTREERRERDQRVLSRKGRRSSRRVADGSRKKERMKTDAKIIRLFSKTSRRRRKRRLLTWRAWPSTASS